MGERTRLLIRQIRRHPLAAAAGMLVFISCMLSGISSFAALRAENRADRALAELQVEVDNRLYAECLAFNESRTTTRELMRDGDKESGEALIETVTQTGGTASQETIERYRTNLAAHLDALIKEHEASDRDCEEEQRLRRAIDD